MFHPPLSPPTLLSNGLINIAFTSPLEPNPPVAGPAAPPEFRRGPWRALRSKVPCPMVFEMEQEEFYINTLEVKDYCKEWSLGDRRGEKKDFLYFSRSK